MTRHIYQNVYPKIFKVPLGKFPLDRTLLCTWRCLGCAHPKNWFWYIKQIIVDACSLGDVNRMTAIRWWAESIKPQSNLHFLYMIWIDFLELFDWFDGLRLSIEVLFVSIDSLYQLWCPYLSRNVWGWCHLNRACLYAFLVCSVETEMNFAILYGITRAVLGFSLRLCWGLST